jgi:hypothetical protein
MPPEIFRAYASHDDPPAGPDRVVRAVLHSDTSPPLYYLLLNAWTRVAGTGDRALKLLSAAFAIACLPLIWLIGRDVGGRRTAVVAGVLFALSPRALYYAAEGRMYALTWLVGLWLLWCTLALTRRGRAGLLLGWSAAGAAALLTHYFLAFGWIACVAWLWRYTGAIGRRAVAGAAALTGVAVLPWYAGLPESLGRWRVTGEWLSGDLTGLRALTAPIRSGWSLLSGHGSWGGSVWAEGVLAAAFAALTVVLVRRRAARALVSAEALLLGLWVLASVIGPLAFDLLRGTTSSLVARYALPGLPAALLLVALAVERVRPRVAGAFLLLVVVAWSSGLAGLFAGPARPWAPFGALDQDLTAWSRGAPAGDLVVVDSIPSGVIGVARYLSSEARILSWVPPLRSRTAGEIAPMIGDLCRVALVRTHTIGAPSSAQEWLQQHAVLQRRDAYPGTGTEVRYYALRRSGAEGCS